jgi:hypothetical protein
MADPASSWGTLQEIDLDETSKMGASSIDGLHQEWSLSFRLHFETKVHRRFFSDDTAKKVYICEGSSVP